MKGFTLIELLAVIVILAIILLIAVPKIADIILGVKKGAFISSVSMIVKAAEYEILSDNSETIDLTKLKYDGKRYESGSMSKNASGQIEAYIWNEDLKLCAVKRYESKEVVINELLEKENCDNSGPFVAIDLKPTDAMYSCYTFDAGTGTITDYDIDNPICPSSFYSPTSIDGVNVKVIGNGTDSLAAGNLTSIDLNDAIYLEEIDDRAFDNDPGYTKSKVTSLTLPDNSIITRIGHRAFNSHAIEELILPNNIQFIGNQSFQGNSITTIILPNTLTFIGMYAFSENNLVNVSIPNSISVINESLFAGNDLTSLIIPNNIIEIKESAFSYNKLNSVTISNTLETIGTAAFFNNLLTNITIPNSITSIGDVAFMSNQLTSITFASSGITMAGNILTWSNTNLTTAYNAGGAGTYTGTQEGTWNKN